VVGIGVGVNFGADVGANVGEASAAMRQGYYCQGGCFQIHFTGRLYSSESVTILGWEGLGWTVVL